MERSGADDLEALDIEIATIPEVVRLDTSREIRLLGWIRRPLRERRECRRRP